MKQQHLAWPQIDILIVSGARPALLKKTLDSFADKLFSNFSIASVFANIDPFQGGKKETDRCRRIIERFFPRAKINIPQSAHFTKAVQWLWSSTTSGFCFHLEDDESIQPRSIFPLFQGSVAQVSLFGRNKNWKHRTPFHHSWSRRRILGVPFGRKIDFSRPVFSTSPSFMKSTFAQFCAAHVDPDLDPEKQLYDGRNVPLSDYTGNYLNHLYGHPRRFVITDIGREFRETAGLTKVIKNGKSLWMPGQNPPRT